MMTTFREHCCKYISASGLINRPGLFFRKVIFCSIAFSFVFILSCKSKSPLSFCEGVNTEGNGVNCGTVFSTGDLTMVITSKEPLEVESVRVDIYQKDEYKKEKVTAFEHKIKSGKVNAAVPLSFYIEGDYAVEAYGKDNTIIGTGTLTVVDTY